MAGRALKRAGAVGVVTAALGAVLVVGGCDDKTGKDKPPPKDLKVSIAGKSFTLDLALDDEHRFRGLSGRENIPESGGMLFVFPDAKVREQNFVMRDCPNAIDIIYLDRARRVTATHTMQPDPPRADEEKTLSLPFDGAPEWSKINRHYEERLKPYPSRHPAQFVIELKGKTLDSLKLKEGDKVELPADDLKKWAQ